MKTWIKILLLEVLNPLRNNAEMRIYTRCLQPSKHLAILFQESPPMETKL